MIPNVSAIYRDLSYIANPPSFPANNYHEPHESSSKNTSYILDKQRKHTDIMQKLRNAQRQSSNIQQQLSGISSFQSNNHFQKNNYNNISRSYQQDHYSYANRSQQPFYDKNQSKWKPPNIKYRHIQDIKQTSQKSQIQEQIVLNEKYNNKNDKIALQKEFYDQNRQQSPSPDNKSHFIKQKVKQKAPQDKNKFEDHVSQSSYGKTWINRESKYQQKLESYYQLCRKRPLPMKSDLQIQQGHKKDKYLRSTNKVSGINLDKAMQMLLNE